MAIDEIEITEENEGFIIADDNTADWALERIRDDEEEAERLISIAQGKIEELEAKIEDIKAKTEGKTSYLKYCLAQYFTTVPHKESKTQESYKLLNGSLVLKKPTKKLVKGDEDEIISHLEANGQSDLVKVKKSVDWANYKKTLTIAGDRVVDENGAVIDCVTVEDVPEEFTVKVG